MRRSLGRDVVSLIAMRIGLNARTLSSMRAVCHVWQKGVHAQWELVRSACMLRGKTSVFRWESLDDLLGALMFVLDKRDLLATRLLCAYYRRDVCYVPSRRDVTRHVFLSTKTAKRQAFDVLEFDATIRRPRKFELIETIVFDDYEMIFIPKSGNGPPVRRRYPALIAPYADRYRQRKEAAPAQTKKLKTI